MLSAMRKDVKKDFAKEIKKMQYKLETIDYLEDIGFELLNGKNRIEVEVTAWDKNDTYVTFYPTTAAGLEYLIYHLQQHEFKTFDVGEADERHIYNEKYVESKRWEGLKRIRFDLNSQTTVLEDAIGDSCMIVERENHIPQKSYYTNTRTTVICRNGGE
jgi:hypothetical protein